jgi:hypothetical protein
MENLHVRIRYASKTRKASDAHTKCYKKETFLQEPSYQEFNTFDANTFNEPNNSFRPFRIEVLASKTYNLLPSHHTNDEDANSIEWSRYRSTVIENRQMTNKAVIDLQKTPK